MNLIKNELPSGCVMTLKDVVDTINQGRGVKKGEKGFKLHAHAMTSIRALASEAPDFGGLKFLTLQYNGVSYDTLGLTKQEQAWSLAKVN